MIFISFEGCEGTGKTTLSHFLFEKMIQKYSVILTKEPGGCSFNMEMRKILFRYCNKIDFYTEALFYAADRIEHLKKVIIPALKDNKIVICDRYIDSSIAYQGYARKLGPDFIKKINFLAMENLPNITFYLDLEPEIGIKRLKEQRKYKIEYFDLQKNSFHNEVRKGYLKLCEQYPERIYKIDATLSLEKIKLIIENKIHQLLKNKI
ncbi:Thymidylate kinase [Candidatus Phytoplasma rubi]|uniref:Thymidylate kinase n=1 Tax=Candidatus Phytoplasma rubi TaxID=399025 RepID=A0ABY7BTP7_9MOLU|nr:dTMP kinase [Candidatus Phytoplasma rubi]WAN63511.1 Thymidylate kinase [Candidatus Phytoplasma rubi]